MNKPIIETPVRSRDTVIVQLDYAASQSQANLGYRAFNTQLLNHSGAPLPQPIEGPLDPVGAARLCISCAGAIIGQINPEGKDPIMTILKNAISTCEKVFDFINMAQQAQSMQKAEKLLQIPGGNA
jgi:hypothetical protein